jgi:hypothetical protein
MSWWPLRCSRIQLWDFLAFRHSTILVLLLGLVWRVMDDEHRAKNAVAKVQVRAGGCWRETRRVMCYCLPCWSKSRARYAGITENSAMFGRFILNFYQRSLDNPEESFGYKNSDLKSYFPPWHAKSPIGHFFCPVSISTEAKVFAQSSTSWRTTIPEKFVINRGQSLDTSILTLRSTRTILGA